MALPGRYGGLSRKSSPFAALIQQVLADLPGDGNPGGLAFGFPSDRAMRLGEHLGLFSSIDRIRQLAFVPLPPSRTSRCRNLQPDPEFLEKAVKNNIPVFITDKQTSSFSAELIRWMKVELAPCISIHGVLVDCYGVGVLIMGDSGIGKSEAALELIKRGHRLVTDDVVEIR